MNDPLSTEDMRAWLPTTRILTYPDFADFDSINDVLSPSGQCAFLYLTSQHYGHWCCLFQRKNVIEVFDSLGYVPDDELAFIPAHFRRRSDQQTPHLSVLLEKSGYIIHYNNHRLQRNSPKVATCGRHCIVRLAFKDKSADAYADMLKSSGNPDALVVAAVPEITHSR